MKKQFFLLPLLFLAFSLQAQLYVQIGGGYGWPSSREAFLLSDSVFHSEVNILDVNAITQAPTFTSASRKPVYSTTGGGAQFRLMLGYQISPMIAVEIQGSYLIGNKTTVEGVNTLNVVLAGNTLGQGSATYMIDKSTTQFRVTPAIIISTGNKEGFEPYARFGVMLPVGGVTTTNIQGVLETPGLTIPNPVDPTNPIVIPATRTESTAKIETKGNFSVGYMASLGGRYHISSLLYVFAEFNLESLAIKGKTSEFVAVSQNGTDVLPGMDVFNTKINYVDELTFDSNAGDFGQNVNTDQPEDAIAPFAQYGNIGINAGLGFKF